MLILGIETSCDDTCVGILKFKNNRAEILANITYSQIEAHQEYGGVFPSVAIREHKKNITKTLLEALKKANLLEAEKEIVDKVKAKKIKKIKEILKDKDGDLFFEDFQKITKYQKPKIDYLSVTIGPGLEPCLWVGVNFAKALSIYWDIPIISVNHIEGHILANWLTPISENPKSLFLRSKNSKILRVKRANSSIPNSKQILNSPEGKPSASYGVGKLQNSKLFPAICLVVSGGHTQLILMEGIGKYKIIGETRDDAAGECFDKVSKILGLGYPGGPAIAQQAEQWKPQTINHPSEIDENNSSSHGASKFKINLPRPMKYQKNFDFSFSGLKTAVLYDFRERDPEIQKDEEYIKELCYKTQEAIIDILLYKTFRAVEKYNVKTIILGGGVSANSELRLIIKKEAKLRNLTSFIPEKKLSVDNGVMIAMTAYFETTKSPSSLRDKVLRAKQRAKRVSYFNLNQAIKENKKIKADSNLRLKNNQKP